MNPSSYDLVESRVSTPVSLPDSGPVYPEGEVVTNGLVLVDPHERLLCFRSFGVREVRRVVVLSNPFCYDEVLGQSSGLEQGKDVSTEEVGSCEGRGRGVAEVFWVV